jgi:hypothetical protein
MTPRHNLAALAAAASLVVAACASGGTATPSTAAPAHSAAAAPSSSTAPVLPVPVSGEFGVGANRVVFSLLDPTGTKPAAAPERHLAIGYQGPNGETIASTPLTFIWAIEGVNGVYIGHADFPSAGQWTAAFTTSAPGSPEVTLDFAFDVEAKTHVLRPGDPAPSIRTPTLADVGGDVSKVSSDATPVNRFYETSEADALAAKKPFVLIFATPKFCQSATCGPTLDRLKPVAAAHPEMTFINVEPYKLEDVSGQLQPVLDAANNLQPVEATVAFGLVTEPFVFVVGADGKISSSFELVFAPDEIEAAIKAVEQG